MTAPKVIADGLAVYEYDGRYRIRVINKDGAPWFSAKDVCEALGISRSGDAISHLSKDEWGTVNLSAGVGGNPQAIVVSESGLYSIILRRPGAVTDGAPANNFRKWLTNEVLPGFHKLAPVPAPAPDPRMTVKEVAEALGCDDETVRRHLKAVRANSRNVAGVEHGKTTYMTEAEVTEIKRRIERSGRTDLACTGNASASTTELEIAQMTATVLGYWKGRADELAAKIAEDAPKVEVYDRLIDASGSYTMSEVAKMLGFGPVNFGRMLEADGYVFRRSQRWMPVQRYVDAGWFVLKTMPVGDDSKGQPIIVEQIRVTATGLSGLSQAYPGRKLA